MTSKVAYKKPGSSPAFLLPEIRRYDRKAFQQKGLS